MKGSYIMKKFLLKTNIYYGWFIVAAGFLIMSTAWGIIYNCTSIFIKPISDDLGFKRSELSAILTLAMSCQMGIAIFAGKIFAKVKLKRLMTISTISLILSYFSYSLANNILTFYILTIIASISSAFLTVLPLSLIISNWFYERKGLAIGIAFMGSGIGGMVLGSLLGLWITAFGWRVSYQILAFIMFIILTPCIFYILEVSPRDLGLTPLGGQPDEGINRSKAVEDGIMLYEVNKTFKFWSLIVCLVIGGIGMSTAFFTISSRLIDVGYTLKYSANITALTMGSLAVSKLILGDLIDKFGVKVATLTSTFLNMMGIVGLMLAKYQLSMILIIVGIGMGNAYGTIALPLITEKMFGRRDFNSIYGYIFAASSLGGVIGPIMSGFIFDKIGNYNISYLLMVVLTILILIAYSIILPSYE